MKKPTISLDLRRRIISAYHSGMTATYEATAAMFGVGRATVSRLLRRKRESGDVLEKPRGGNNRPVVDDVWLRAHAQAHPDSTVAERVEAWAAHSGRRVHPESMRGAMHRIGWTHKKKRPSRESATRPKSKRNEQSSPSRSPRSKRDA